MEPLDAIKPEPAPQASSGGDSAGGAAESGASPETESVGAAAVSAAVGVDGRAAVPVSAPAPAVASAGPPAQVAVVADFSDEALATASYEFINEHWEQINKFHGVR